MTEDEKIIDEFREALQPAIIPEYTLDVVKEALDRLHEDDEKRPLLFRQYDDMLAMERMLEYVSKLKHDLRRGTSND